MYIYIYIYIYVYIYTYIAYTHRDAEASAFEASTLPGKRCRRARGGPLATLSHRACDPLTGYLAHKKYPPPRTLQLD